MHVNSDLADFSQEIFAPYQARREVLSGMEIIALNC
jgi:hypothetical protein